MVLLLSVDAGDHEYKVPPDAFNCTDVLLQMSVSFVMLITGFGFTVIVMLSFAEQPEVVVPVTMYFVDETGTAIGFAIVLFESVLPGTHE